MKINLINEINNLLTNYRQWSDMWVRSIMHKLTRIKCIKNRLNQFQKRSIFQMYIFNEDIRNRMRNEEKRGQGHLSDYRGWLTRLDGPNNTEKYEVSSPKYSDSRSFVAFGSLEKSYLDSLLFLKDLDGWGKYKVKDVRDQFAAWPQSKTLEIAAKYGLAHPMHPRDRLGPKPKKFPTVMTIDFMVTVEDGDQEYDIAITIKPTKYLNKKTPKTGKFTALEHFEILRRFFEDDEIRIPFKIVTEHEINQNFAINAAHLNRFYSPRLIQGCDLESLADLLDYVNPRLLGHPRPLSEIAVEAKKALRLEQGQAINRLYHLITIDAIRINMNIPLSRNLTPTQIIHIMPEKITNSPLAK